MTEAQYILQLEGAIMEIHNCVEARRQLDAGFKSMGYNILQEKAGKLHSEIRRAKKIIERWRDELALMNEINGKGATHAD